MQATYDRHPKRRVMKKLWHAVSVVRPLLEPTICQQGLRQNTHALLQKGVIYCIFSWKTRHLYVGQTSKSCYARFQEHVREARTRPSTLLHRLIHTHGYHNFGVFPLEKLPDQYRDINEFKKFATPRELFWIQRLHTHVGNGLNMEHRPHGRQKRRRNRNPLKRYRQQRARDMALPVPNNGRKRRDWRRRCEYLEKVRQAGQDLRLHLFSRANLLKMRSYLLHNTSDRMKLLFTALDTFLKVREHPRKRNIRNGLFLKLQWTNGVFNQIRLRQLLMQQPVLNRLPAPAQPLVRELILCNKLNRTIGGTVLNFHKTVTTTNHNLLRHGCPCHTLFPVNINRVDGCVATADLSFIFPSSLRALLERGPRFRENSQNHPFNSFQDSLRELISVLSRRTGSLLQTFSLWETEVLQQVQNRLNQNINYCLNNPPLLQNGNIVRQLKWLQRYLVFVPVDKAPNNIACICKRFYMQRLNTELASNSYELCHVPPHTITTAHQRFLNPFAMADSDHFPCLYWLPKFHKNPIGARFIAGAHSCTTTAASRILSALLLKIQKTLMEKDNQFILQSGIRRFFVVNSFEEVAKFLGTWLRHGPAHLFTADFTTMYTAIPHQDLINRIAVAIDEAAAFTMLDSLEWKTKQGSAFVEWSRCQHTVHSKRLHVFNKDEIKQLVAFVVNNTYLFNQGRLFRQSIGIPMGTNCAPQLANLYLYTYEAAYVDRLIASGQVTKAEQYHMTFRLIDDVLSIDNQYCHEFTDGHSIYPACLHINDTSANGYVHFLGMKIFPNHANNGLHLQVYDKRKIFPFHVRNYPYLESNIPQSICYGVFVSLINRFHRICTHMHDFFMTSVELACLLANRGYNIRKLSRLFALFVRNGVRYQKCPWRPILNRFLRRVRTTYHSFPRASRLLIA
ncbi:MAG: hypothetical protein WB421_13590 [Terriglobales bacterium]